MKAIIFILFIVSIASEAYTQFPPPSCDSLPQYQFLRHTYSQYIGKTIMNVLKEDSLLKYSRCFTVCNDSEIIVYYSGIKFSFHLKEETPISQENYFSSFLNQPIEHIFIMVEDIFKYSELHGAHIICLLHISREER